MMTSSMSSRSTPERRTASRMATAPSSGADSGESPPRNRPIGVRTAEHDDRRARCISHGNEFEKEGADAVGRQPRKLLGPTRPESECEAESGTGNGKRELGARGDPLPVPSLPFPRPLEPVADPPPDEPTVEPERRDAVVRVHTEVRVSRVARGHVAGIVLLVRIDIEYVVRARRSTSPARSNRYDTLASVTHFAENV